jgi:integrase
MLEQSLGILFYLKKVKNQSNSPIPIYLRITVDGIPKELSLKRSWLRDRWSKVSNRAKGNKTDCKILNEFLDLINNKVYDARRQLIERGQIITSVGLRNILEQRKWYLLAVFQAHNDEMRLMIVKGVAKATWTNYNTTYNHVSNYFKLHYPINYDVNLLSLDLIFVKKLYQWFRTERKLNNNSAIKNIDNLKKVIISCVDNGWLTKDPFNKFRLKRNEVDIVYLTKAEVQRIVNKEICNDRLDRVRDLFIFCCFTGLSFIDVRQLKKSEILIDSRNELRIHKRRQKTGTTAIIPLLPVPKLILTKYANDPVCISTDMLLPVLSNQKYNSYLKELAVICNIEKDLTSKMARNTFGTTVTMANNVPLESISKMMGHKSLKQTQHYAKVLALKVSEDMYALNKRLAKSNFYS